MGGAEGERGREREKVTLEFGKREEEMGSWLEIMVENQRHNLKLQQKFEWENFYHTLSISNKMHVGEFPAFECGRKSSVGSSFRRRIGLRDWKRECERVFLHIKPGAERRR